LAAAADTRSTELYEMIAMARTAVEQVANDRAEQLGEIASGVGRDRHDRHAAADLAPAAVLARRPAGSAAPGPPVDRRRPLIRGGLGRLLRR
jgi:hypothetical protein